MRVAYSLTLPDKLEAARAAGTLVVFAGAGVSMGPPSSLPGFESLAKRIGEPGVPFQRADKRALDRYLGRVGRAKIDVQARAREILTIPGSHTPLHESLVGIFGTAERVRLITTNFDRHFTSAFEKVFPGERIPQYVGPALPPGQHFRGIAQLHGSLDHPEHRLVLTDGDFADAYMADGWASRFLARVFAERTVLFVGYSLSDPIMRYLLHALPPTGRWYGLWHEREVDRGAEHPIVPVTFANKKPRDRFGYLIEGMQRWHWYSTAPPSDHDHALRQLIRRGPPVSPVDIDYIRARLTTESGLDVFWAEATTDQWFKWAAAEGLLKGLLDDGVDDGHIGAWARWCLNHFCSGDVPPLLQYLRGQPLTPTWPFSHALALHIWRSDPLPRPPVLRQLLALLVSGVRRARLDDHIYGWVIERLTGTGFFEEALTLLRVATELRLEPLERLYFMDDDAEPRELRAISVRVATRVPAATLVDLLQKHGKALVSAAPEEMLALAEQRIAEAYQMLDLARGTNEMDWFSFGRTAIAASGQDRSAYAEDALVELVRPALDRLGALGSDQLTSFIDRNQGNKRTLLRRLAIYALSVSTTVSSDEVLARAAALGWPRDALVRPELYRVLGVHFPRASEEARRAFISELRDDAWWGEENEQA